MIPLTVLHLICFKRKKREVERISHFTFYLTVTLESSTRGVLTLFTTVIGLLGDCRCWTLLGSLQQWPGQSSQACNAETPGLFDYPLNHWAAHFEASQLKFKRRDFTFNKLTTADEGGEHGKLTQAAISQMGDRSGGWSAEERTRATLWVYSWW